MCSAENYSFSQTVGVFCVEQTLCTSDIPVSKTVVFFVWSRRQSLGPNCGVFCMEQALCTSDIPVSKTVVFSVRSKRLSLRYSRKQNCGVFVEEQNSVPHVLRKPNCGAFCVDFPSANLQRSLRGVHLCASRYPFSKTVVFSVLVCTSRYPFCRTALSLKLVCTSKYAVSQNVVFLELVRTSKTPSDKLWSSLRGNKLQMTLLRSVVTTNL